eukprot:1194423-Prorocentrum_minimum.AAC.5
MYAPKWVQNDTLGIALRNLGSEHASGKVCMCVCVCMWRCNVLLLRCPIMISNNRNLSDEISTLSSTLQFQRAERVSEGLLIVYRVVPGHPYPARAEKNGDRRKYGQSKSATS